MANFHFILNPGRHERCVVAAIVDGGIGTTWCAEESAGWNAQHAMEMVATGERMLALSRERGFYVRHQGLLLRDATAIKAYERWTNDASRAARFHSLADALVAADSVGGHVAPIVSQATLLWANP